MGIFDSLLNIILDTTLEPTISNRTPNPFPSPNPIPNPFPNPIDKNIIDVLAEIFSPDKYKNKPLEKGDIIGISRKNYDHYGIYIGNDRVIHYSSEDSDISGENTIIETRFSKFLRNNDEYFILNLEYLESRNFSRLIDAQKSGLFMDDGIDIVINAWQQCRTREVYSPEETVNRAKSRLGENKYSLLFNNCEHFAIWCKTGISESHQVNEVVDIILKYTPHILNRVPRTLG